MKRSEINSYIKAAMAFFKQHKFYLPQWAFYAPDDWQRAAGSHHEIIDNMLGWDLTDFGNGEFLKTGLLLFTLRNGNLDRDCKPYAEKIMVVREHQVTPMHYHSSKMDDIINPGGGNLVIEIYGSTIDGQISDNPVKLKIDGIERVVASGEKIVLSPGESICLEQGVYHRFWGEMGIVLVGEVSMVNDDTTDNYFYEKQGRFPEIIEDELPLHLLCNEYTNYPKKLIRK